MPPAPKINNWLIGAFLFVAFIGFADAAYLTFEHYSGTIPPCSLANGCETVLTSPYATVVGNIPVALVGATYYLILTLASIAYLDTKNETIIKAAAYFTWAGFLTSVGLVTLQLTVIKAICLYCIVSAGTSTLLFILGMMILKKMRESHNMEHKARIT